MNTLQKQIAENIRLQRLRELKKNGFQVTATENDRVDAATKKILRAGLLERQLSAPKSQVFHKSPDTQKWRKKISAGAIAQETMHLLGKAQEHPRFNEATSLAVSSSGERKTPSALEECRKLLKGNIVEISNSEKTIHRLDAENEKLKDENEKLKDENEKLKDENEKLKTTKQGGRKTRRKKTNKRKKKRKSKKRKRRKNN